MGVHSIAEAKERLPELIDLAIRGEGVVITRHGHPVAELRGVQEPARRAGSADLDWLAERRRGRGRATTDAATLVSQMRDEDWR